MDPACIPKKYGGKLNWTWGDIPDLDAETREALERDGNRGWVKGPALWLNNERVVVGSENGKERRSAKEIAEKKPIIYAADYTEEPVHPEKKASVVSVHRKSLALVGKTSMDRPRSDSPSTLVEEAEQEASIAMSMKTTSAVPESQIQQRPTTPKQQQQQALPHVAVENVRTSPMGDSQVHLPTAQPAAPATTAEYINPTVSVHPQQQSLKRAPEAEPVSTTAVAAAASIAPTQSSTRPNVELAPHPAGHAQPGPLSDHQTQVSRKIADQLEKESTVVIPATANGILPHPDIVASSDKNKGLAIEEDKLTLDGHLTKDHTSRPQPERFVTAVEF